MPFNSALSAGNYDTLRGTASVQSTYAASVYLSLCPNTTVFAARVNQTTFAASFAVITFDTVTTGAYTDIKEGMTILIGSTSDPALAKFTLRVRANNSGVVSTSTTININETSADLADNWYIFVINDYRLWDKLGRDVAGVSYKDYDHTFIQLRPLVYGLKSAYAGWISGGVLTVSFAPSAVAATSGATISTWAWDVGDGTITVGSASTQNITATFPAGFRWIKLTVTDNGSRSLVRHIPVWAHDAASYPPQLLTAEQLQVTKTLTGGVDATVTAFDDVSTVYDNTLVVAWGEETYQDSAVPITGDNILFVGRFQVSTDTAQGAADYALVSETRYTLEGVLTQLARIEQLPYEFLYDATPTVWGDINNLTLWRAIWLLLSEHSTFGELHSLRFDDTTDTYLVNGLRTQGGNVLSAVNDLAVSVNGALQVNCAGQSEVVTDARMQTIAQRAALTVVANWTASDILDLAYEHRQINDIGRLKATGGAYNSTANNFNTFESRAPGVAQDYPEGSGQLERQVLTANASAAVAQLELNTRAGNALARQDNPDTLNVTHPDGYHWLIPALDQWYTFTLDGTEITRGIVLTTAIRWLLVSVTVAHDSVTGTKTVQATYTRETSGAPGQTVTYPPITTSPLTIPTFPPFDLFPAFPIDPSLYLGTTPTGTQIPPFTGNPNPNVALPPANGNSLLAMVADQLWATQTFLRSGQPHWIEITPGSTAQLVDCQFDIAGSGGYLLGENPVAGGDQTFDFTLGQQGWTLTGYAGTYSGGVGFIATADSGGVGYNAVEIEYDFLSASITSVEVFGYNVNGRDDGIPEVGAVIWSLGGGAETVIRFNCPTASSYDVDVALGVTCDHLRIVTANRPDPGTGNKITKVIIHGGGGVSYLVLYNDNVFELPAEWTEGAQNSGVYALMRLCSTQGSLFVFDASNGNARFSSDYGATWGGALTIGGTPHAAALGFDVLRIGATSLAAASGQVYKATTLGGAYSAYGSAMPASAQPTCILIPRYQFGGTTSNNTTTPQYLVASSVASGGASLWKVTASGATFTDITPTISSNPGLAIGANCLAMPWYGGSKIAAILSFGGTLHLVTSTNAGSSWTDRGALDAAANFIRFRKGNVTMLQLFWASGGAGVGYSNAFGGSKVYKTYPDTSGLVSIAVYG